MDRWMNRKKNEEDHLRMHQARRKEKEWREFFFSEIFQSIENASEQIGNFESVRQSVISVSQSGGGSLVKVK